VYDDDSGGDSGVDDDLFPGISLLKHHSFNCWVLEVCLIDLHLLSSHLSLPLESVITWRSTLFKQLPFILSCMYHLTYLLIVVLDTEPRALYMLGKRSTTELRPQSKCGGYGLLGRCENKCLTIWENLFAISMANKVNRLQTVLTQQ
jgi:hypothetical protein